VNNVNRQQRFSRTAGRFVWPLAALLALATPCAAGKLPDGYWGTDKSQPILDKTRTIRLAPDLSTLTEDERQAVERLLEVGQIFQRLYEVSMHHQALDATDKLMVLDRQLGSPVETRNLLELHKLFKGPIATTLDNEREAFLPVDPIVPGKNVYPWGVTKPQIEVFLSAYPSERDAILQVRTVVRSNTPAQVQQDLGTLQRHPALDTLHPGLRQHLDALPADAARTYYAVPYSVAYADELVRAYALLHEAAGLMTPTDPAFAQYLRARARDLLCNDYEGSDAIWVSSRFDKLNAMIGSYEVYDDELYATKSFFAFSLLLRDAEQSDALRGAIRGIQQLEDSLPYAAHKRVREDIPVGVYNVIADFGQARGTNTATILPNEAHITRKYGRTILMRYNMLTNADLFQSQQETWLAAMDPSAHADQHPDGSFYRTLWHEIGHYLGPDMTRAGMPVTEALEENSSTFEEMKADLVSLFVSRALRESGYHDAARVRQVYAAGIRRVLRNVRPRREQPYATMQLMQMNFFLENGLLEFDTGSKRLRIHYDRYHDVVAKMLAEVLSLQYEGDKAASDAFIDRYTTWDDDVHGALAAAMRDKQTYRYTLVRYGALGE
jgi:hypothetical protein